MTFHQNLDLTTSLHPIQSGHLQSTASPVRTPFGGPVALPEFDTLKVTIDADIRTIWCHMDVPGKPIVTRGLLQDLGDLQDALAGINADNTAATGLPLSYFVFASHAQGVFSLGGDLALFAESVGSGDRETIHDYATSCIDVVYRNLHAFNLPVITMALVQGDALGGGFETALSYDLIVAERSSKMGFPEILFNLFPGMGAYSFLARRLDAVRAEKMIMSGRIYTAEELHEMGIVDVLAEDGCGEAAVYEYIQKNAAKHNAHRAIYQARRRCNPITRNELRDIVDVWTDAVFQLSDADIRKMARLMAAQDRRFQRAAPSFAMAAG
jgi:DSF synthase